MSRENCFQRPRDWLDALEYVPLFETLMYPVKAAVHAVGCFSTIHTLPLIQSETPPEAWTLICSLSLPPTQTTGVGGGGGGGDGRGAFSLHQSVFPGCVSS